MDFSLLVRGTVLGFSIAAPVGPIGVLVFRESMTIGRHAGLLTGLVAAAGRAGGTGLGAGMHGGAAGVLALVAGVLLGSSAWWPLLTAAAGRADRRLTPDHLRWVNRGSGLVVAGFGALALVAI